MKARSAAVSAFLVGAAFAIIEACGSSDSGAGSGGSAGSDASAGGGGGAGGAGGSATGGGGSGGSVTTDAGPVEPPVVCTDQCRYVRPGAAGSGDGSDWTNAFPALPADLERGKVYLIADGSYGAYGFDDAPP